MNVFALAILILVGLAPVYAQEHVIASAATHSLPDLTQDRPAAGDLQAVASLFNGQHSLESPRAPGIVTRSLATSIGNWNSVSTGVIAEGVVLRSDAYLAADRNGVFTVLSILPTVILEMPANYPPSEPLQGAPPRRARTPPPARAPIDVLRFALAGGTVWFDSNNAISVRQTGIDYPVAGTTLVLFGRAIKGSSALMLEAACALENNACASIDGSPRLSDVLSNAIPGGRDAALAFSLAGAPVADATTEGVRGLAATLESRYYLVNGDLRQQTGPLIPIAFNGFLPASDDAMLVRGHVLSTDATLTLGGSGLVTHAIVAVDKTLSGPPGFPRQRTFEVVQRGGLLRAGPNTVLAALLPAQLLLAEGGDYFLSVGRTSDNRWELRSMWRVVNDHVYALDRLRTQPFLRGGDTYWKSAADFLSAPHAP